MSHKDSAVVGMFGQFGERQKISQCMITGWNDFIQNTSFYILQGSCLKLLKCFGLVSAGSELQER